LAPAEAHERPDVAHLVRRVGVPLLAAVPATLEERPVALERGAERTLGHHALRLDWFERDGRARGVEVPEVRATGEVVDAVHAHGRGGRSGEVMGELLAARRHPARV